MPRINPHEGDWFAVPLLDGGWGVGVVSRASRKGVLFGYFFGPRRNEIPTLADVRSFDASEAVLVSKFGYLGLRDGDWPILGRLTDWDRRAWPMPPLIRYEELTGRTFKVVYDDSDPNKLLREEPVAPGVQEQGPKDGLMGAGFAQKVLTKLLASS